MLIELDYDDLADRIIIGQMKMGVKLREGARDRIRDALQRCEYWRHTNVCMAEIELLQAAERAVNAEIVHPEPPALGWCNRIPKAA